MPDPHVTVLNENTRVPYVVGSTPQDTFVIPFTFYEPADIKVYNGDTIVPPANYTVTGNAGTVGGYEGGHVTLNTPVSNTRITIILEITIERTTDFPTSADFKIPSLNTQFDRIISIAQQLNERMSRALVLPVDDDQAGLTLPSKSQRTSKVLGFDSSGNIDVMVTDSENVALCQSFATSSAGWASVAMNAASGFKMKNSVRASTASALPSCVYNNGSLTAVANGALVIDSVINLTTNDRVLIKDQAAQLQNGIYTVGWPGSPISPFTLNRATDMDSWSEVPAAMVVVEEGTINSDKIFLCTSNSGGVMGTAAITFADISLSITPQDGSITTAKLADSSVSAIKIIDGIVSYQKLASAAIASLADWASGTASKILSASNFLPALSAAIGFSKFYDSGQITIAPGGMAQTHSLGATPKDFAAYLVCTGADMGYSIGDTIKLQATTDTGTSSGLYGGFVWASPTQVGCTISTSGIAVYNKSTGAYNTISGPNWKIVFRAWA